jgi:hypothetical protein
MTEPAAEEINLYIKYFTDIYKEGKIISEPLPDDVVTYYCDDKNGSIGDTGFVYNIKWKDGGIEKLVATKWILQKDLEFMINFKKEYPNWNVESESYTDYCIRTDISFGSTNKTDRQLGVE